MDARTRRIRRLERALWLALEHLGDALTFQHDQSTADFVAEVRAEFPRLYQRVFAGNMPPRLTTMNQQGGLGRRRRAR